MKNPYVIAFGVILIILIPLGIFFVFNRNPKTAPSSVFTPESGEEIQEKILSVTPEELGLVFEARRDKKAVKFSMGKIDDIASVEYEISYLAEGDIPRGAIGQIEVKPEDSTIETSYIDLGTCSSGKCKYDEGVSSVKLILKITKTDGKIYQSEKELEL